MPGADNSIWIELIRFVANMVSMSVGLGLIFVILLTSRRDRVSYAFSAFALTLVLWSFGLFIRFSPLRSLFTPETLLNLLVIVLFTKAVTFYIFTLTVARPLPSWLRYINIAGVLHLLAVGWLILSGRVFTSVSIDTLSYNLSTLAYILLFITITYLCIAFYVLSRSQDQEIRSLRFPAAFVIGSYFANAIEQLNNIPLDTLLSMFAVVWIGSIIIKRRLFDPFKQLNHALNQTNKNLRKAVTDLEREKSRVEALNEDLQRTSRYKSEFMATMSHELRTPLNSIIGYSELLTDAIYGELNEQQLDRVDRIARNGEHLSKLINGILDLNRMDAGQLALEMRLCHVSDIVTEVVHQYEYHAEEKQLALRVTMPDDLPQIQADPRRLAQILGNLLDNAIKFTSQGHVAVTLALLDIQDGIVTGYTLPARGWLADGRWLLMVIEDTGIGIDSELHSYIFDQFSQADSSRTRAYEGIGLGLTITMRLVDMHQGSIWLDSQVDEGTRVFAALPYDQTQTSPVSPLSMR
jgi:signal transduction histidine kinase